jgi:urate oxidase
MSTSLSTRVGISLGTNQYGKAENRVVRIYRDTARHEIVDLNVSTSLRGDFGAAHTTGDQADVLPTDTQKNTAFVYAKLHGVRSPEDYAIALGRRFLEVTPKADSAQIRVEQYPWDRIPVGPNGHDHAFVRRGGAVRTTIVTVRGRREAERVWVVSGLQDLVLLKSTGSEFKGYLRDEYTTLQETDDRILATSLIARWRYVGTEIDWNARYDEIQAALLETFATTYSRALQETLYLMGEQVLKGGDDVAEIRFSAPNKHHFLVDLPGGVPNDGEVFIAADRPYGLIEATVSRDDAPEAGDAWLAVPGFA